MLYYFLFDIIYQITKGIYYLHDMQTTHRNLKPDNVLINYVDDNIFNCGFQHAIVKLINFGESKMNVRRNPIKKKNKFSCGTSIYRILEVLN